MMSLCGCATSQSKVTRLVAADGFWVEIAEFLPEKSLVPEKDAAPVKAAETAPGPAPGPAPRPSRCVLILPPTGGANFIDKSYARGLSRRGAAVKILLRWAGQDEKSLELSLHQVLHERALRAIELTMESVPEAQQISLMGTSVGALFVAISASQYARPDRLLAIAGGVPIPEVIANSDHESMVKLRKDRFKKFGFNDRAEYESAIHEDFLLDPIDLEKDLVGKNLRSKKLGLIYFTDDETVPTKTQLQLLQLWQPQFKVALRAGHVWGIIKTWWSYQEDINDFLLGQEK